MKLFDAHNHLQRLPAPRRAASAIEDARKAGVVVMAVNAVGPKDWPDIARLAADFPDVIVPCFGAHPWTVEELKPGWEAGLRGRLEEFPSACVGEIGLDRAPGRPDFALQLEIFRSQLRLAGELGRPAVVHCVGAWEALLSALKAERPAKFLLHAYGGAPELVPALSRLGAYFSFAGALAQPRRRRLRLSLAAAPKGRVLFETDSPGPAPGDLGWRGGPADVAEVVADAAGVLGMRVEELADLAWRNAGAFLEGLWPRGS